MCQIQSFVWLEHKSAYIWSKFLKIVSKNLDVCVFVCECRIEFWTFSKLQNGYHSFCQIGWQPFLLTEIMTQIVSEAYKFSFRSSKQP